MASFNALLSKFKGFDKNSSSEINDKQLSGSSSTLKYVDQLKWLKSKVYPKDFVKDDISERCIAVIIHRPSIGSYDEPFSISQQSIWEEWVLEGSNRGFKVKLFTESTLSLSDPINPHIWQRIPKINSRDTSSVILSLIKASYEESAKYDKFLVCSGASIPIMPVESLFSVLFSSNNSRLYILDSIKFRDDIRGTNSEVPSKAILKMEDYGMTLTRYHAHLILQTSSELNGNDLTRFSSNCKRPELIYFPTLIGLLGCWNSGVASGEGSVTHSSPVVVRLPTVYSHTTSRPGDDFALPKEFPTLSKEMMIEFRQSGSFFATRFPSTSDLLFKWRELVLLHYQNSPICKIQLTEPMNYDCLEDSDSDTDKRKRRKRDLRVKLVINSHVNYRKPLSVLLQSILNSDFTTMSTSSPHPEDSTSTCLDIIVVLGQASIHSIPENLQGYGSVDQGPFLVPISSISDVKSSFYVTAIYTSLNNYDWTGLHQLSLHKRQTIVQSDYYLYLLDTCRVDEDPKTGFWKKVLSAIPSSGSDPYRERVRLTTKPHSSIAIFGKGVIENYQNTYEREISKEDGLVLEMYEKPLIYDDGLVLHGLQKFGDLERLTPRSPVGRADWYGTGRMRVLYYYHDLGVTKAILEGGMGDISPINPVPSTTKITTSISGKN